MNYGIRLLKYKLFELETKLENLQYRSDIERCEFNGMTKIKQQIFDLKESINVLDQSPIQG